MTQHAKLREASELPRRREGAFLRDASGSVAIEFAFILPLLALMLLGTVEISRAVNINRHFTAATNTLGDLIAQEQFLGTSKSNAQANLDGMMRSIEHLMQPYDSRTLKMSVFMVRASHTDPDDTRVEWSYSFNGGKERADCSFYPISKDLIGKGGFVVVVESSYDFTPLFADFVPGFGAGMQWEEKSFHIPRKGCVSFTSGNSQCVSKC
jgi:Flp pilus assembly pilin Flp